MKNRIRVVFQVVSLGLIGYVALRALLDAGYRADFEAYCPFGGIASMASKLSQGTMSCTMSEVQLLLGAGLLLGVILVGKIFCSYVCPIGAVTEWLGTLGGRLRIRRELPRVLDRPFRSLKYGILFAALYFTMTTSELFCKEFDPYFATANLFHNSDVKLYFAIPALVLTILGGILFRLFWCKYLCPLNAISNIFLNAAGAGAVIGLFIIARIAGLQISYVYLIAGLVLVGLITELGFLRSFLNPFPRITRSAGNCTACGLCDKKCSHGIKVSELERVTHIDCTLCTDCVYACPSKTALTIHNSRNLKYLSPVVVLLLVSLSLAASLKFELTTISERWGNFTDLKSIAMYEQTGLKNIKCYSSSMSLKAKLATIDGICGLDTYARSHTVKVYYNPAEISEKKVKASLFTSTKMEVRRLKADEVGSLAMWEVGIGGLFDLVDINNLFYTLREDAGVYGFETRFGEPVQTVIFYDPGVTNTDQIKRRIEIKTMSIPRGNASVNIAFDFKLEDGGATKGSISAAAYRARIFVNYDRLFNDYKDFKNEQLSVLVFPMPEAALPAMRRSFGSLASHLSADPGIVRLSTRYMKAPMGLVFFDPEKTSVEKIRAALVKPQLTVFLNDTDTRDIPNPFHLNPEGKIMTAAEWAGLDDDGG